MGSTRRAQSPSPLTRAGSTLPGRCCGRAAFPLRDRSTHLHTGLTQSRPSWPRCRLKSRWPGCATTCCRRGCPSWPSRTAPSSGTHTPSKARGSWTPRPQKLVSRDADAVHNITITVAATCNPALGGSTPRGRIVDLVTASWPADQVVGRQVLLAFIPPQGAKAGLGSRLDARPLRVATLRLQTDALPVGANPDLSVAGKFVTVQGDVLGPASAVPTPGAGTPGAFGTVQVLSDADRASALARVASIGASANATAFTEAALELAVTDSTASAADGLAPLSSAAKHQATSVDSFTLYSNVKTPQRPRVLILYR